MKSKNWKDFAELFGITAIVVSLIFVGVQARQDQVIARSELASQSYDLLIGFNQSLMDQSFAGTYAKMLDRPEDLTVEELVQIDGLLDSIMLSYRRECFILARGIFVECEDIFAVTAHRFFTNMYAQSWLREQAPHYGPELVDHIEAHIVNLEANSYRRRLEESKAGT